MKKVITLLFTAIIANAIIAQTVDPTITVPQGFKAAKIAEGLGTARHIAISPKGEVYVKLNYGKRSKYQNGILNLLDLNKDGLIDSVNAFGNFS